MNQKEFNAFDKSEHKDSIYDQIDAELSKYYDIKFNENSLDYELYDRKTNKQIEFNLASLLIHLKREKLRASEKMLKTYLKSHFVARYNPIRNYLKNLEYNGKDNIKKFCSYVNTDDDALFYKQMKKWAVRAVKSAFENNQINKHCIVLANGDQHAGKSTYLEYLVPDELRPYYTENIGVSKDDRIKLCKCFIVNVDELEVLGKRDVNSIKALISQKYVNERLPYGEKATLMYRIANFVASTNRLEFLTDETGNVRWIIFDVIGKVDFSYSNEFNIDDFWAEAYHIYKNEPDFQAELTFEEVKENERRNEKYNVQTVEAEYVLRFYEPSTEMDDFRTATDIITELTVMGQKLNSMRLGRTLKKYGYKRIKHPKRQAYGYLAKPKFNESVWAYYNENNK